MAYHHGNLRTELLARAETVLADSGVEALSLRSLARDLGVSHAAPARHFPDRRALLDALAVEGFGRLGDRLRGAVSDDGRGFEERLTDTALTYVRFATAHPALLEVMYARKHDVRAPEVRAASDACAGPLLGLFAGGTPLGDPERFGVVLLAGLHGIAALAGSGALPPAHSAEDLAVDMVRRLLRGSRAD
ncbi:TetR/AcrR family transcriptional regulator [Streptomyces sp. NPDC059247]|uniref:TetR/AcrR family transcriptional regulator n=1 Tax=Streptomyces sp. NPDC059247 TaxID=3346790 RepID=UPI00369A36D5